ncbi:hypothetical protein SAMN06265218_101359 [Fodinibius sediminis]|uniref:Uncharacterized protein n=1 Tax=Fodinibius sediminis TaxID=1214077 RepID=A0A521ATB6_9BACT|nr:hypothetical protein SAMN06265218_101359 [Fodinibius sediminis]
MFYFPDYSLDIFSNIFAWESYHSISKSLKFTINMPIFTYFLF